MKLVIVESPFSDPDVNIVLRNIEYAQQCLGDSLNRGEAPIASHLLYTQILDDNDPKSRTLGISAGFAWMDKADLIAVYADNGISKGMQAAIERANMLGIQITFRTLSECPNAQTTNASTCEVTTKEWKNIGIQPLTEN